MKTMKKINFIKSIFLAMFIILINGCTDIKDDFGGCINDQTTNTDSTRILVLSENHYLRIEDAYNDPMTNIRIVYLRSFVDKKDVWSSLFKIYTDSSYTVPYNGTNEYQKVIENDLFYISTDFDIIQINNDGIVTNEEICH